MRVDRLLSILLIISSRGMVTGRELAQHFEVSLRTIYRDIEKLCEAGVPVASNGGTGGGFSLMENYSVDNLFLNKNELQTLIPLMDNLKFLFGKNNEFNNMVLKLESTYKSRKSEYDKLNINMSHFSMEEELKEYLYLMNKAIEEDKLLIFDYINRNMEYSQRTVEPIQIAFSHGQWHLVAFCRVRGDYRRFKLVRIRNLIIGGCFTRKAVSRDEIKKSLDEGYDKKSINILLRFSKRIGEQLTEYFHKDCIRKTEDGFFLVEDYCPYEEGLYKFILSFGTDCEVIEPLYLRENMKKYIGEMAANYNS